MALTTLSAMVVLLVVVIAVWRSQQPVMHSGGGEQVVLYHGDGFDFAYPEDWRVIAPYQHYGLHGPTVVVVVGNGDFDSGCVVTSNSVTCAHEVSLLAPPDRVVVAYHVGAWLPIRPLPSPSLESGDQWVQVGGRSAVFSRTQSSVRWEFPGAPEYIDASFGSDVADQAQAQIEQLIASWRWSADYSP